MFHLKDLILLIIIYSSLLAGVLFPEACSVFQPLPLYSMMSLLFLSFLSISIMDIWRVARKSVIIVALFLVFRMLLLPVCFAFFFRLIWPDYSLSALLLSGISTGVVAPFISSLLGANSSLVLVVVVASSLLVPFTLPLIVDLLFGKSMEISLTGMMRLLAMVVFIPVVLAEMAKRLSREITGALVKNQYYVALGMFSITNMGIFSKYSEFFHHKPMVVGAALLASIILGALYLGAGLLLSWGRPVEDQMAAVICLGIMNNVLVIVFSSQFFTPLEPTVAAMYMIPFFALILPLRAYGSWKRKHETKQ
jgi:BASS family bile acid:Na+ symporter